MYITYRNICKGTCDVPPDIIDLGERNALYQQSFNSINIISKQGIIPSPTQPFPTPASVTEYLQYAEIEELPIEWQLLDNTIMLGKHFGIDLSYEDIFTSINMTDDKFLGDAYDGYMDVLDLIAEHRVIVSASCKDNIYSSRVIKSSIENIENVAELECGIIEARCLNGTLCGAIWLFYQPNQPLILSGQILKYTFVQGIFSTMPYFYLKLVAKNKGIQLESMADLLIPKVIEISKELQADAIRIHPLPNMHSILTRKYGFMDINISGDPYGVIGTPAPSVVIKYL